MKDDEEDLQRKYYIESMEREAEWMAEHAAEEAAMYEWMHREEPCSFDKKTKVLPIRTFTEAEFVSHIKEEFCDDECLRREYGDYKNDKDAREEMLLDYGFAENRFYLISIEPATLSRKELKKLFHTPGFGDLVAVPGGYGYSSDSEMNQFKVCYDQGAKKGYISERSYQNYLDWQSYDPTPF